WCPGRRRRGGAAAARRSTPRPAPALVAAAGAHWVTDRTRQRHRDPQDTRRDGDSTGFGARTGRCGGRHRAAGYEGRHDRARPRARDRVGFVPILPAGGGRRRSAGARRHARLVGRVLAQRHHLQFRSRSGNEPDADREADAGVRAAARREARPDRAGHRVRSAVRVRTARASALADGAVPARVRAAAAPDVADERDGERRSPRLHGRPRPHAGRRGVSNLQRRLDRLLGRRAPGRAHESADGRAVPAHATRVHRSGRNRRDLGEGRRPQHRGARLGVRPAGASGALVREADVHEAVRSGEPADPLLALLRESEQRRHPHRGGRIEFPRFHFRRLRRETMPSFHRLLAISAAALLCACADDRGADAVAQTPAAAPSEQAAGGELLPEGREARAALGLEHSTAWELYEALKARAGGGERLSPDDMPDWTGLWTRVGPPFFDPAQQPGQLTTAKLKPEALAELRERRELASQGIEYDPISDCSPPGHPRWLVIPFLREFIVTPDQTWLTSETVNNIRRIYTEDRKSTRLN